MRWSPADFLRRTIHRASGSTSGGASLDGAPTINAQRGASTHVLGGAAPPAAPKPQDPGGALAPQNGHGGAGPSDAASRRPARRRSIPLRVNGAVPAACSVPAGAEVTGDAAVQELNGGVNAAGAGSEGEGVEGLGGLLAAGAQRVSRRRKAVAFDLRPLGVAEGDDEGAA